MKKVVLSKRLQAVADMVSPGNIVCDVGCDHGLVPVYLIEQGICAHVLAMDVRPGPLEQARSRINERQLTDYIETRLSDGIRQLHYGEADTLIMAGMGSRLMEEILSREAGKAAMLGELILQPQSEIPKLYRWLRMHGYITAAEEMVREDGKFYYIMKVRPSELKETAEKEQPGRLLWERRHPVMKEYLEREREKCRQIMSAVGSGDNNKDSNNNKDENNNKENNNKENNNKENNKVNNNFREQVRKRRLDEVRQKAAKIEHALAQW